MMAWNLLKGNVVQCFKAAAATHEWEMLAVFNKCTKMLVLQVFPKKTLVKQKQYMWYYMKKPWEMKVQQLAVNLWEIMKDLIYYLLFAVKQVLSEDKTIEFFEFMMPGEWKKQMILQGIEVTEINNLNKLIKFCERMKVTESIYNAHHKCDEKRCNTKTGYNRGNTKETL